MEDNSLNTSLEPNQTRWLVLRPSHELTVSPAVPNRILSEMVESSLTLAKVAVCEDAKKLSGLRTKEQYEQSSLERQVVERVRRERPLLGSCVKALRIEAFPDGHVRLVAEYPLAVDLFSAPYNSKFLMSVLADLLKMPVRLSFVLTHSDKRDG